MKVLSWTGLQNLVTEIKALVTANKAPSATASVPGIMKLYTSTGTGTDGTITRTAITNAINSAKAPSASTTTAGITKVYTTTGSSTDGTMTQKAITTAVNGAKAPSANTTTAGIMRLYTGTGSNTNGTMTQSAITTAVNNAKAKTATASVAGVMKLYTSTGSGTDGTMTRTAITNAINAINPTLKGWESSKTSSAAGKMSITISGYRSDMVVFAYMNGLLLEVTTEYTVSSSGVVTTVNSMNSGQTMTVRALWVD